MAALFAEQFAHLAAADAPIAPEAAEAAPPAWATRNRVTLELPTMRLRDFSTMPAAATTLICAPFALHGSTISDFAPGHSLVAALLDAGRTRLFVTEWRSATPEMRFHTIDSYLADLNVAVDELGGAVDLIGPCQGGWMALMYAARFPAKVRRIVLAGAPIDMRAEDGGIASIAANTPLNVFRELVQLGDGRMLGRHALVVWQQTFISTYEVRKALQRSADVLPDNDALIAQFRAWYAWAVDLPGSYYLQVAEQLFQHNALAEGRFIALGRRIDLADIEVPILMLAARDDELVAAAQMFATETLVATPPSQINKMVAPCNHLGLFMGARTLAESWPAIARWMSGDAKRQAISG
jgi:poly(3-hydroxyalkanoate) synthetase